MTKFRQVPTADPPHPASKPTADLIPSSMARAEAFVANKWSDTSMKAVIIQQLGIAEEDKVGRVVALASVGDSHVFLDPESEFSLALTAYGATQLEVQGRDTVVLSSTASYACRYGLAAGPRQKPRHEIRRLE